MEITVKYKNVFKINWNFFSVHNTQNDFEWMRVHKQATGP